MPETYTKYSIIWTDESECEVIRGSNVPLGSPQDEVGSMVPRNILAQSQLVEVREICGTINFPEKPILFFFIISF